MLAGRLYRADDPDLVAARALAQVRMNAFNAAGLPEGPAQREALAALLGRVGEGAWVRPPLYVDYGAYVELGDGAFLNFGCVLLDVCPIRIGEGTQIGPMVQILTADHPRDPALRAMMLENGRPIAIGRNVWIGGGAILLPGVSVGCDAVIGAGAVVTRDVAEGETVAGNPARPLRPRP